ncbi:MAG: ABC transporter permease [Myxococcaceae bacterium]
MLRTPLLAVLFKELVDHLRDRRSLLSALMFPIFGPVSLALMMNLIASWADKDQPVELAVVEAGRAPTLMSFLERYGIDPKPAPADYEAKIQDGTLDAVLVIPEDFASRFSEGRPAPLQLVYDQSRRSAGTQVERVQQVLQGYSGYVANLRLLARGVSPELAMPLQIEEVDLATPEKLGAMLLNMIPIFLVLATFVGGMNLAIDVTAGERERGSLEPLLVNPAPTNAIVLGKWLATVTVSVLGVVITLVGFFVALGRVPLADLGVKASMGVPEAVMILAAVLPLTLFASSVQMVVATYARSFKEAQTWLSLLLMIPMIPGMVMSFVPFDGNTLWRSIPVMGQHLMIDAVMRGEGGSLFGWLLSLAGVAVPTVLCVWASARLLRQERIIYGR